MPSNGFQSTQLRWAFDSIKKEVNMLKVISNNCSFNEAYQPVGESRTARV
jgi:hypothetical protein